MKEILPPSLLPYLQSGKSHFRLEISLSSRETSFLQKSPFPFLTITESSPFERLGQFLECFEALPGVQNEDGAESDIPKSKEINDCLRCHGLTPLVDCNGIGRRDFQ